MPRWSCVRRRGDRRSRRRGGRSGPRPGAAAGRARRAGFGRHAGRQARPGAPEGQLPPALAGGPRAGAPGRRAPPRRPHRAAVHRHRFLLRRLPGRARGGGERPRALARPAVRPLPDRPRRPRGARGRRAGQDGREAGEAPGHPRHRRRDPVPLRRGARRVHRRAGGPSPPQGALMSDRVLDLQIDVPGTPEQVWEAIATGPGVSAWLHPTEIEERTGGTFTFDMGAGPVTGDVTAYEPPRRIVQEVSWRSTLDGPEGRLATEWIVEARDGGTCTVRMVTRGFGSGQDWDAELEGFSESMTTALETLRLHLTHFGGTAGGRFKAFGAAPGPLDEGWAALTAALGVADATEGTRVEADGNGTPRLAGVVERAFTGRRRRDLHLRLTEPAPGIATVSIFGEAGATLVQGFLYGDEGAAAAARAQPEWETWMRERF